MRRLIPFVPVAIQAISATTPAYLNIADIFDAALDSTRIAASDVASFDALGRRALEQLGIADLNSPRLVLATTKGNIDQQVEWMRKADSRENALCPLPTLAGALHNLGSAANLNAAHVVSTACTSGLIALIDGAMLVRDAGSSTVIAVGVDTAADFVRDGFTAFRALSPTVCRPFDKNRNGLALGSAAACCVLTANPNARALAFITGFGVSNDCTHLTAPDRHGRGLIRAIREALRRASLQPGDIDAIFSHGTGTPYNDAMEAVAIESVFLSAGARPAVTAMKGLIGHTLGASGLVEAALAVEMLRRQTIPPIVGLQLPENSQIDFVLTPRKTTIRHILKIASGFGGTNAAIVLSNAEQIRNPYPVTFSGSGKTRSMKIIAASAGSDRGVHMHPPLQPFSTDFNSPDPLGNLALRLFDPLIQRIPADKRPFCGLIIGTTLGCLEIDREFDRSRRDANGRYASPAAFSRTLPSTIAAELAIKFQLTGPSLVLSAGDASAAIAIRRAFAWLHQFDLDYCIAGGMDHAGPNVGPSESKEVVFFLLARDALNSIAELTLLAEPSANLLATLDESLIQLAAWVRSPTSKDVAGVQLKAMTAI